MKTIVEAFKCNGCSACAQICPTQCITMQADGEGFLRPIIDKQKCIDCGRCQKTCPVANPYADDGQPPLAIGAANKNEQVRSVSSSGGVFSALAERILASGGVVFGAGFDNELNVVHKYAETEEDIGEFRGSKYVQSKIGNCYIQAKEFLESGREVLFTGTPCQIGGLYAYLGKEYCNLYTQDFICHGVPSPAVWQKYIAYREKAANAKAEKVFFRDKRISWQRSSMCFVFADGTDYTALQSDDEYMQGFLFDLYLRPSCHQCEFKKMHRKADITLADFWGIDRIAPQFNDNKGISLLLIHSEAGKKLWDRVSTNFESFEVSFEDAIKSNPSYLNSVATPKLRKSFFKKLDKKSIDKLILGYSGRGYWAKIRRFLSRF